jgi:hypothetical protein
MHQKPKIVALEIYFTKRGRNEPVTFEEIESRFLAIDEKTCRDIQHRRLQSPSQAYATRSITPSPSASKGKLNPTSLQLHHLCGISHNSSTACPPKPSHPTNTLKPSFQRPPLTNNNNKKVSFKPNNKFKQSSFNNKNNNNNSSNSPNSSTSNIIHGCMAHVVYSIPSINSLFGAKLHLFNLYRDRPDVSFDNHKQHLLDTTCYVMITINVKEIFSYHTNTPWNFPVDQEPCFLLTSKKILHQPVSKNFITLHPGDSTNNI